MTKRPFFQLVVYIQMVLNKWKSLYILTKLRTLPQVRALSEDLAKLGKICTKLRDVRRNVEQTGQRTSKFK